MAKLDPEFWDNNDYVYWCLADVPRTRAFRKSIRSVVKPGDIVVDLGAGTGVLGFTAAQCGAERVYLVELDSMLCRTMRESAAMNDFNGRVEVVEQDALSFALDGNADVVICEMIATAMICEFQAQASNHARQFSDERTVQIPGKYTCIAELVHKPAPISGMRLAIVSYDYWGSHPHERPSVPLTGSVAYREFDFSRLEDLDVDESFELTIARSGNLNGLRLRGTTLLPGFGEFDGSTAFSNPMVLPVREQPVNVGQRFRVELRYRAGGGFRQLQYEVTAL